MGGATYRFQNPAIPRAVPVTAGIAVRDGGARRCAAGVGTEAGKVRAQGTPYERDSAGRRTAERRGRVGRGRTGRRRVDSPRKHPTLSHPRAS